MAIDINAAVLRESCGEPVKRNIQHFANFTWANPNKIEECDASQAGTHHRSIDSDRQWLWRFLRDERKPLPTSLRESVETAGHWPISRNVPIQFQRRDPPDFTEGTHPHFRWSPSISERSRDGEATLAGWSRRESGRRRTSNAASRTCTSVAAAD